jgi:hypothetical protein
MKLIGKTQYSYWNNFLSYKVLFGLSALGGLFALDHLYLRSPTTFVFKLILNAITFGLWWIWETCYIAFNKDTVQLFGTKLPMVGGGIGAGVFSSDTPSDKHLNFLFYALALFCLGIFGADSFILGRTKLGIIRVLCAISIIGTPIAIGFWIYNIVKFFFATDSIVSNNSEFFGTPPPKKTSETVTASIPIVGSLLSASPIGQASSILKPLMAPITTVVQDVIAPVAESVVKPIVDTIQTTETVIEKGLDTAQLGLSTIKSGINTVGEVGKVVGQMGSVLPAAAMGSIQGVNPAQLSANLASAAQKGGAILSGDSFTSVAFISTIVFIAVSGLVVSYRRFSRSTPDVKRRNKSQNDTPPEPGAL